jgi:hypothetical protein
MKIKTLSSAGREHEFGGMQWKLAYHGGELDERSRAGIEMVKAGSSSSVRMEYLTAQPDRLCVDGQLVGTASVKERMRRAGRVVLETTSLGFVEVLQLLKFAKAAGLEGVDCLYVEPSEYTKDRYLNSSWAREFSLSESRQLEAVRGFSTPTELTRRDARLVAFLGYEASRLAGACEQNDAIVGWKRYAVFGVPGYAPGWEMNAMANNIDTLVQRAFESVRYCAASSVSGAYELLEAIHREGSAEQPHTVVAPFGTKPHGIACALFLVGHASYQASSLIYDHPGRSKGRSSEVRRWHMYRVQF